jgi:hypothetical protein
LQERVDAGHDARTCRAVLLLAQAEHHRRVQVLPPALEVAAAQARVELCYIYCQVQIAVPDLLLLQLRKRLRQLLLLLIITILQGEYVGSRERQGTMTGLLYSCWALDGVAVLGAHAHMCK